MRDDLRDEERGRLGALLPANNCSALIAMPETKVTSPEPCASSALRGLRAVRCQMLQDRDGDWHPKKQGDVPRDQIAATALVMRRAVAIEMQKSNRLVPSGGQLCPAIVPVMLGRQRPCRYITIHTG